MGFGIKRFGIKSASVGVLTGAIMATAACSSSGTVGTTAAGAGSKSTSAASTGTSAGAPTSAASTSVSKAASSTSAGGASGAPLTAGQISKLLLTDKDDPGYTYDAAQDGTATSDTPDQVTSGGSACQTFVDAENGLSTKYGTTAEVDRQLKKTAEGHVIQDSVMAFPSSDKAAAMVADATAGLQGCKSLKLTIDGSPGDMAPAFIPQLTKDGQLGYINYLTISGKTVLMAAEMVHVGQAISVVILISAPTQDKPTLEKMGATLSHLSDIQVGRLKKAQGMS